MDTQISKGEIRRQNRNRWTRFGLLLFMLAIGVYYLFNWLRPSADADEFRIAVVEQGPIEQSITASGLVVPASEQLLTAPTSTAIRKVHQISGAQLTEGDLILELDAEYVKLQYDQLADELELRKNNVEKLKLEYNKNLRDLELGDQIQALQLESLEAQLVDIKRLREVGGATEEEVEQAELKLKIARLEKKKLENELGFRKQSITNDRRNLELEVQIQAKKLRELERKLSETAVKAPTDGVLTWINEEIGKTVAEGELLARLANLSSFRIEATGSDMYTDQIKLGMPIRVRINRQNLTGVISAILPAVENNTIQFHVALDDPQHSALRSNMRVEVFIITNQKENVLKIVNGPAFTGAREQDIFVVKGSEAIRKSVRVGLSNVDFVELQGDIAPGDRVIVSDVKNYRHMKAIQLK